MTTNNNELEAARNNLQQWAAKVLPQEPREFVEAIERFTRAVVDAAPEVRRLRRIGVVFEPTNGR